MKVRVRVKVRVRANPNANPNLLCRGDGGEADGDGAEREGEHLQEMYGDMGRCREIWGEMGRYGAEGRARRAGAAAARSRTPAAA